METSFQPQLDSNVSVSLLWGFCTSWQQIGVVTEWPQNHCDRCAYKAEVPLGRVPQSLAGLVKAQVVRFQQRL